jgi:hypothetical protein
LKLIAMKAVSIQWLNTMAGFALEARCFERACVSAPGRVVGLHNKNWN